MHKPRTDLVRLRSRALGAILLAGLVATVAAAAPGGKGGKPGGAKRGAGPSLTWYGQACFLLESKAGTKVVMDPIPGAIGYTPPSNLQAHAVTVSHEHGDHNNVALVKGIGGEPKVFRGLSPSKKDWVKTDEKVKDVAIRSVGVYHDDQQGKQRGLNSVFVFETGGKRIAHLGDLGHLLTDAHLQQIGEVDVVLVPVGGVFTIDAAQATKVIEQLKPKTIVVPMHYRTDVLTIKELSPIDPFLEGKTRVRRETGNVLHLGDAGKRGKPKKQGGPEEAPPAEGEQPEIVVLNYK